MLCWIRIFVSRDCDTNNYNYTSMEIKEWNLYLSWEWSFWLTIIFGLHISWKYCNLSYVQCLFYSVSFKNKVNIFIVKSYRNMLI